MGVNRAIPALFQGVSQQPAAIRSIDQVEALENGYVTVADGDRKRPPTEYVKFLKNATPSNGKCHQYFRGDGEHNIIVSGQDSGTGSGVILAFDGTAGAEKAVDSSEPGVLDYIYSLDPMDDIGMLTVADTTFIWNRTKTVATVASTLTAPVPTLFVYVSEAVQSQDYTIWLETIGGATTNSGNGAPSTVSVALALKNAIAALPGSSAYTVTQDANLLAIQKTDGSEFQFNVYDSAGGSMMTAIKNQVERYSDLPRHFQEGVIVKVQGEADVSGKSAFWVTYKRDTSRGTGYWEETTAPIPGEVTKFDKTTMPHELVRNADGSFTLKSIDWSERLVGSTSGSCPVPSFVGQTINSVFFYRGRLGILAGENVVLSRANDLFNFWPKTAQQVLDDDPIDVTANTAKIATLRHAVPFQRMLVLFSDTAQFPLTGGTEALTPKTVRLDQATEFDCSDLVTPVSSGQDLFFVFERSSAGSTYSGVREYFVNEYAVTNDAVDVTAHIPQYIPRDVFCASVSSTEDVLLLVAKNAWNTIYFYKYLWDGDKKVQSAWGRWTFRASDKILSAAVDKTSVHLVIQRVDGLHLEVMNLQSTATTGTLPFQIHLDSLQQDDRSGLPPSYDGVNNETTLWVPAGLSNTDPLLEVVAGDSFSVGAGSRLKIVGTSGSLGVKVKGNWTAHPCYMGLRYEHRTTISELFMRDQSGVPIQQGRLQVKHFTVNFKNAVTFSAEVATPLRDTAKYVYTALQLGVIGSLIGAPVMRSGSWTFPVASKSSAATITLVNDSPYPATFYACEWEGEFFTRNRRV